MVFSLLSMVFAAPPVANTTVSAGALTVVGLTERVIHTHGGPAASLRSTRFKVVNTKNSPVALSVSQVEYLTGHSCTEPPSKVSATMKPASVAVDGKALEPKAFSVVSGEHELFVGFSAVEAYYNYCDFFAFRVTFQAGEEVFSVVSEVSVMRVTPAKPQ